MLPLTSVNKFLCGHTFSGFCLGIKFLCHVANPRLIIKGVDKPFFKVTAHSDKQCMRILAAPYSWWHLLLTFLLQSFWWVFRGSSHVFICMDPITNRSRHISCVYWWYGYLLWRNIGWNLFGNFLTRLLFCNRDAKSSLQIPESSACKEMGKYFNAFHRLYLYFLDGILRSTNVCISNLTMFALASSILAVSLKNLFLIQYLKNLLLLSSKNFLSFNS